MRRALVVVVGLVACGDPFFEGTITDRRPFAPPPVYADWWDATEACSGRSGDLMRIEWFLASSIQAEGKVARGRWSPPHEIIIVQGYEDDPSVVRHEMLHDLLDGDAAHEDASWDDCGLRG